MDTLFPTYRHLVLFATLIIYLSLGIISVVHMFSEGQCDIADYLLFMAINGITTWFAYRAKKAAIRDGGIYQHTLVWLYLHSLLLWPWGLIVFSWVIIGALKTSFPPDPMPLWLEYAFRVVGKSNVDVNEISSAYLAVTSLAAYPCIFVGLIPLTQVDMARTEGLLPYPTSGEREGSDAGDPEFTQDKEGQV